jgi:hypothetical protein
VKTSELARLLAANVEPLDRARYIRRFAGAMSLGLLAALALTRFLLHWNPGLGSELSEAAFWVRELYCAALAAIAMLVLGRLGHPGARLGLWPTGVVAVIVGMWTLGALALVSAPAPARAHLFLGSSFKVCSVLIAGIATPLFIALLWVMKGLAPTQLRRCGAAAGFAAGALGALVYSLHCPELAPPFIGAWYLLGMLIPTGIGAVIGPRLLRW